MDTNESCSLRWWQGFLVLGTIWGMVIGYVIADYCSESNGALWFHGSYPRHRSFVTSSILICPGVGLLVGFILDSVVPRNRCRATLFARGLELLVWFVALYLLWTLFWGGSVQSVRE